MLKYILGLLRNLLNPAISIFALIDISSKVNGKAKINRAVKVYKSQIGKYTYVGKRTSIVNASIGSYCSIASNCSIGLAKHSQKCISTSPLFTSKYNGTGFKWTDGNYFIEYSPIQIGNDVWIGDSVIIPTGVKIGHGAVIGAGAVVTKDVAPYAIVAGVPARVIKYRFEPEVIDKLLEIKWWELPESALRNEIKLFQEENITIEMVEKLK